MEKMVKGFAIGNLWIESGLDGRQSMNNNVVVSDHDNVGLWNRLKVADGFSAPGTKAD